MRWIVTDAPTWLVGVVLIVGLPIIAVLLKIAINRKIPSLSTGSHNEVAGILVSIVGVVYAVIIGFTIVSLYEASSTVNQDVSTEAAALVQLHDGNFVLGPTTSARVNADILRYANAVVTNWTSISEGTPSQQVQTSLDDLYATFDSYTPHTMAEGDYLSQSIADLDNLSQARNARALEASESGSLPLVLWIAIILTSAITLLFSLLFSIEDVKMAYAMVAGVAVVLAVDVYVLVELGYPFLGSVSIGPSRFADVVHLLGG